MESVLLRLGPFLLIATVYRKEIFQAQANLTSQLKLTGPLQ